MQDINQDLLNVTRTSGVGTSNLTSQYNPYIIETCGGVADTIAERVDLTRLEALKGLSDTIFGINSEYGFTSMFKDNTAKQTVQSVLQGISSFGRRPDLLPEPYIPKAPRVACITQDSAGIYEEHLNLGYDPWQKCLTGGPDKSPITSFYAPGTAYVFLCPALFMQTIQPSSPHCPTVHNNRFAGDPNIFYQKYQVYIMLYSFLEFYLGTNALNATTEPPEQLDWNNGVQLGASDSVRNPTNFQIYVASKYSPVSRSLLTCNYFEWSSTI